MTTHAAFTPEEWETVLEAPTSAGMIVITASPGGTIRETFSMAKAYTEAREQHGASELLDEIVSTKPKVDRHVDSPDDLEAKGLQHVRDAVALIQAKATPEELEDYRRFVVGLAERVAHAHREHGVEVSDAERAAIEKIHAALGSAEQPG
jgi:hypothetical protein